MSTTDPPTYAFIPPRPLPEFYLKKRSRREKTSTSSSSTVEIDTKDVVVKDEPSLVDGAYDRRPRATTFPRGPSTTLVTFPPPDAPNLSADGVPPLAIYHICRMCLRPRSSHYHSEHPIPVNGLPPPPGICRRCRVTSVEETKRVAEIVKEGESNKIKLGFIQPFVPDEDIISDGEMKEIHADRYLRRFSSERASNHYYNQPRKDVVYRHLRVVDDSEHAAPEKKTKVTFTRSVISDYEAKSPPAELARAPITETTSMQVQPTDNPTSMPMTGSSTSLSSTSSSSKSTTKALTKMKTLAQPQCTGPEVREIARDEIERYRQAYWTTERSDSNIRKIAREEVERYRQAERKLEAHPGPYAHGRMVPVERRIEQERDATEPMPWTKVAEEQKVSISSAGPKKTQSKEPASTTKSMPACKSSEQREKVKAPILADVPTKDRQTQRRKYRREFQEQRREGRERRRKSRDRRHARLQLRKELDKESDESRNSESSDNSILDRLRDAFQSGVDSDSRSVSTCVKPESLDKGFEPFEEGNSISAPTPAKIQTALPIVGGPATLELPKSQPVKEQEIHFTRQRGRGTNQTSAEPSASQEQWNSSKSSKWTNRDNWQDESMMRTVDTRTSRPLETCGSSRHESQVESTREPKKPYGREIHNVRRVTEAPRATSAKDLPYPEHDSPIDRIVRPIDEVNDRSFSDIPPKSGHSARDNDKEYLYAERIVQPANRPFGRRPFDDHPPVRHIEVEEVIEWKRSHADPPKSRKKGHSPQRERSPSMRISKAGASKVDRPKEEEERACFAYERSRDRLPSAKAIERRISVSGTSKPEDFVPSREHTRLEAFTEERQLPRTDSPTSQRQHTRNDGKQDPRVQFSSQVDISPTPPGSDASSSKIRRFHRVTRKNGEQIDGNHSPKPYEDAVEEYKRRGRMRSRDRGARYDHFEERESVRERGRDREAAIMTAKESDDLKYDGRWQRRLARALSESPSREASLPSTKTGKFRSDLDIMRSDLKDLYKETAELESRKDLLSSSERRRLRSNLRSIQETEIRAEKLEKAQSDAEERMSETKTRTKQAKRDVRHLARRREEREGEKVDGRGPYRVPEKVTDSMKVENGSPEESFGYQRWRDV